MKPTDVQIQSHQGDIGLLQSPSLTAFLCSHRVPIGTTEDVTRWVDQLPADTVVMCGNLTGIEQLVLSRLQQRGINTVLVLATAMAQSPIGNLLVITPVADPSVTTPTGASSAMRNQLMISLAQHIVVGFMSDNGRLARSCSTIRR